MIVRRLVLLGLWILSLVTISYFGGPVSYGFFFAVTMVPLVSVAYLIACAVGVKIHQTLASRTVTVDEGVDYFFVLNNETVFSFPCVTVEFYSDNFTIEKMSNDMNYELLPGEKYQFNTTLSCKYRGEYPVGVKAIIVTDGLKLFRWKYKVRSNLNAIVNPKIVNVPSLRSISDISAVSGKDMPGGQDTPDAVVRDYVKGDPLKKIHWKASAKTDSLKVCKYFDEEEQGIYIYCDNKRCYKEISRNLISENKILETYLAVASFFCNNKRNTVVFDLNGSREIRGPRDFTIFYEEICSLYFSDDSDEGKRLEQFTDECIKNAAQIAFFVVHELSGDVLEKSETLGNQGILSIIYVVNDDFSDSLYQYMNDYKRIYHIGCGDDLMNLL